MKARIALTAILAVLLSACGSSNVTQTSTAAPVTQATIDAARDANATIIAASIPTAAPTDTPKPAATTATRSGTVAVAATTIPTRSSGASSASLSQTFQGPQRCVFVRYPSDWTVEGNGLEQGQTEYCPGGAKASGSKFEDNCTSSTTTNTETMFSLFGPETSGDKPEVSVAFIGVSCRNFDDMIEQEQKGLQEQVGVSNVQSISMQKKIFAGYPARCLYAAVSVSRTDYRLSACYVLIAGNLFEGGYGATSAYWQQFSSVLDGIVASLELHPI